MKRHLVYPTHAQLKALVVWSTKGSDALASSVRDKNQRDPHRTANMNNLRELIRRLDLDPQFLDWFAASSRSRRGELDTRVLAELQRTARFHGYVTRGCTATVPLNGQQLHAVRLLADGFPVRRMEPEMLLYKGSIQRQLTRAKLQHAVDTNASLVARAYLHEWLPTRGELLDLVSPKYELIPDGFIAVGDE